jgi:anti-anti-sigma factor
MQPVVSAHVRFPRCEMTSQSLRFFGNPVTNAFTVDPSGGTCSVRTFHQTSHTMVKVSGEIDLYTVDPLLRAMRELNGANEGRVIVDLDDVSFIGATGLDALVAAHNACDRAGGHLEVRTSRPSTLRLLTVTGLTHLLDRSPGVPPPAL